MNHRKTLYGYQIRDGEIAVVEEEAILVRRVFSLYIGGLSYQKISDLLNREEIPYSQEAPAWNKHKVKRLLENPRYTGQDGYPAIIDKVGFEETQSHIHEKTAGYAPKTERPVLRLKRYLRCSKCGAPLRRVAGKNHRADTLYLKCSECGAMVTIPDEMLLEDVTHQVTEHDAPSQEPYQPSEEVIRLTNAINRGLEHPDHPEELVSLILQGAAARYDCCPQPIPSGTRKPPAGCGLEPHPAGGFSYYHLGRKYGGCHLPISRQERKRHGTGIGTSCTYYPGDKEGHRSKNLTTWQTASSGLLQSEHQQ